MSPDIEAAKKAAISDLEKEQNHQLANYRAKAGQIIAELRQPTMRNVLGQAFWLMLLSATLSVVALVFALKKR